MTERESYIKSRNENNIDYLYEYYINNVHLSKVKIQLPVGIFWGLFQMWEPHQIILENFFNYFDSKFEVVKLMDLKTNKIIRYE